MLDFTEWNESFPNQEQSCYERKNEASNKGSPSMGGISGDSGQNNADATHRFQQ